MDEVNGQGCSQQNHGKDELAEASFPKGKDHSKRCGNDTFEVIPKKPDWEWKIGRALKFAVPGQGGVWGNMGSPRDQEAALPPEHVDQAE